MIVLRKTKPEASEAQDRSAVSHAFGRGRSVFVTVDKGRNSDELQEGSDALF